MSTDTSMPAGSSVEVSPDDLLNQALASMTTSSLDEQPDAPSGVSSLPPAIAAMKGKSSADILAELNKSPLFMTELEENDDLEAFKALAYEGTPYEVALSFKEHGNECFRCKQWVDAKEFFNKAIVVLQVEIRKREGKLPFTEGEGPNMNPEEMKNERVVLEACLSNRAATHLKLKNYRSCTLDCASTIRLNPKNIKAWFRSSTALLAMSRIKDADECCARGLALDPTNKDLLGIADQIVKKAQEVDARRKREAEAEQRRIKEAFTLKASLKAREIKTRKTAQSPEMEDACVKLVPDPADPTSSLVFPTVFLYPVHLQSDFVKDMSELEPIGERLKYILADPMPWDSKREYAYKNVECYMETVAGGLIKLGKSVTLLKVLSGGKVEVVDDVVKIFVLPNAKAEAWVQEFKSKKAAEKTV